MLSWPRRSSHEQQTFQYLLHISSIYFVAANILLFCNTRGKTRLCRVAYAERHKWHFPPTLRSFPKGRPLAGWIFWLLWEAVLALLPLSLERSDTVRQTS